MRLNRVATAVLVAALCSGAAARGLRKQEDPVLQEIEKYETAPTEAELAKVDVHIDDAKQTAEKEAPGVKLGTTRWRELVTENKRK